MSLAVNNLTKARIQKKALQDIYKNFLRVSRLHKDTDVSLAFVDSKEMRKLNRKYRKKDNATDVLSFSYKGNDHGRYQQKSEYLLGEIVICPAEAKLPISVLFAHGLAHLLGYTHETEKKADKMERLEEKIYVPS